MTTRHGDEGFYKVLFLDDEEWRHKEFAKRAEGKMDVWHAHGNHQAICMLQAQSPFDIVFLDFDLGGCEKGIEIARFIAHKLERKPSLVVIHSWNKDGAAMMEGVLKPFLPVEQVPFTASYMVDRN